MKRSFYTLYLISLVGFFVFVNAFRFYKQNVLAESIPVNEFPRIAIRNHFGEYKTIDDYKGKTILVDFWFSACPLCLDEMKYFPELLKRYDDLVIMSFSVDSESHTKKVLENKPKPWTFLITDNPRWTFYNVDRKEKNGYVEVLKVGSFPTYFLINKNGEIISSPRNAIYSVEKELGGLSSLGLSFDNYLDEYDFKDIIELFLLFNLLAGVALLSVFILKRDVFNQYIANVHHNQE